MEGDTGRDGCGTAGSRREVPRPLCSQAATPLGLRVGQGVLLSSSRVCVGKGRCSSTASDPLEVTQTRDLSKVKSETLKRG